MWLHVATLTPEIIPMHVNVPYMERLGLGTGRNKHIAYTKELRTYVREKERVAHGRSGYQRMCSRCSHWIFLGFLLRSLLLVSDHSTTPNQLCTSGRKPVGSTRPGVKFLPASEQCGRDRQAPARSAHLFFTASPSGHDLEGSFSGTVGSF